MEYERKQFKVDAFFVNVNELQEITNLDELKNFINRNEYFKYHVFRSSEGMLVFRVFNPYTDREELRMLEDNDVLYYPLTENGGRCNYYVPLWDF